MRLKSCPFCGKGQSKLDVFSDEHGQCWIVCTACRCTGPLAYGEKEAAKLWNKRYNPKQKTVNEYTYTGIPIHGLQMGQY